MDWGLRYKQVASNAAALPEVAGDAAILVDPTDVALTADRRTARPQPGPRRPVHLGTHRT